MARNHLARGDLVSTDQALALAEGLVQHEPVTRLSSAAAAFRVQYWLAAGELEAARHWAEHAVFTPDHWEANDSLAVLALVQVRLAQHQSRQALDLLERFRGPLNRPGDTLTANHWLALCVVALHQAGEREQACTAMERLLAVTEPAGDLRVYLDLGDPMRQALHALLAAHTPQRALPPATSAYVSRLVAAFEQEPRGTSRSREADSVHTPMLALALPPPAPHSPADASVLPAAVLTRREQEVLRLLAEGASNQEIANTLVIQQSTVKKHVSNVLSKLAATSRTQAVAQARVRALL